jgi:hypothetical protein
MFNSTIIDVAIGMIFIYLLLSLMCSSANEIIELMLKKRAIDLERGIRELLVPGSASGTADIVQKLYDHAAVNNLFGRTYEQSRIGSRLRRVMRTQLPSYIPARSFALALMDLVGTVPASAARAGAAPIDSTTTQPVSGAAGAMVTPPIPEAPAGVVINIPKDGEAGVAMASSASRESTPPPPPGTPENALTPLRNAISGSPLLPEVSQRALILLVDAAGNDVAKARENIENWYNSSMDRVSSWYKRRAQLTILILGLFVAIAVNVDTITIAKRLSTDKAIRESLVAASDAYAKANAAGATAPTPTTQPNVPTPQACLEDANKVECQRAKAVQAACADPESPKCKYLSNQQQIESLGLPIGWDAVDDPKHKWPGLNFRAGDGWFNQIYWHWLGWLLTALAISLGAPFWFDLLNKFIVIRSAVKPHEKSPEEKSKD